MAIPLAVYACARLQCAAGRRYVETPLNSITMLHYSEHMAEVPDKRLARYQVPLLQNGERVWVEVEEYDTANGIVDWAGGDDYFPVIAQAYLESGRGHAGTVGAAASYLFEAAELHVFAVEWMERTLVA